MITSNAHSNAQTLLAQILCEELGAKLVTYKTNNVLIGFQKERRKRDPSSHLCSDDVGENTENINCRNFS